jgi:drug/metabolite transporter (DMT)-like permease
MYSAIFSALLFGISPVACKAIVGQMPSSLLAGLLYLGSGLGLTWVVIHQATPVSGTLSALSWRQRCNFAGAVISGGVAAPLFLAYGIRFGTATEVSLLLNFESVATTLLAWMIFHEYIGYRVWIGKALIVGASILVVLTGSGGLQLSIPGLSVLAACLLWGVDNNLTRELESIPAPFLACMKGWIAGIFNVLIFLLLFRTPVTIFQVSGALIIGALSYGASLVLFIHALREIGSARTSTWFASGPLFGTILAIIVLGERPPGAYWIAGPIMLSGLFFLYREVHRHVHRHERVTHSHAHEHDEHHLHQHVDGKSVEKHDHLHVHTPTTHTHDHWPDVHHRHTH